MVFKENLFIQGGFFNWPSPENVSRLAPPKMPRLAPPYFKKFLSMAAERGEIPNTLTFSIPRGGQYWTLNVFLKSVIYRPTLREIRGGASPSKFGGGQSRDIFRGGPVKKITL